MVKDAYSEETEMRTFLILSIAAAIVTPTGTVAENNLESWYTYWGLGYADFSLTGFRDIHFEQVKTYTALDRHPLKRVITICFYALVKPENHPLTLRDNITSIDWFDVDDIPNNLGFDHGKLINEAHSFVRNNLRDRLIVGELLPKEFTLHELQNLYEDILNVELDRRNFRKRIFQMDVLKNTGKKKQGVKGGPYLYRLK